MHSVDIRNDTKDLDLGDRFKAMIEASPKYNVEFKWVTDDNDPDCCFVISDHDPEQECLKNEHYIIRENLAKDPRKVIWNMIKHLPALYCLDYGSLYLEKISQ
jgi:hypothetical protein